MECYLELKENKSVVNLEVTETWWRSYQVNIYRVSIGSYFFLEEVALAWQASFS